jgi:hypothetical protein
VLHYINNIFNLSAKIFKKTNKIYYVFININYKLASFFFKRLQQHFLNLYSVLLQSTSIPFGMLTNAFKTTLILFISFELWNNFLTKIKNGSNIYLIRKNTHKFLHNFWVVNYKDKFNYNVELNLKHAPSTEISNFYFSTALSNANVILFYFFNKLVFNKYPYFYWVHKTLTENETIAKSQNIKTKLFFMYINVNKKFCNDSSNSFFKLNLNTFKGASNFFTLLAKKINHLNIKFIKNFKITINPVVTNVSNQLVNYKKYDNLINFTNLSTYKYLNIILNNANTFSSKIYEFKDTSFIKQTKTLTLVWYTKIHNTTDKLSSNSLILYLRSSRHFNKGRYSRNRQLYRTGVYWCIWLNVVVVYALHYYFYRVVFAFGYLWLPLGIMIATIFGSRLYKYRFYNLNQIVIEMKEYSNLLFYFFLKLQLYIQLTFDKTINNCKNFAMSYAPLFKLVLKNYFNSIIKLFK